MAPTLTKSTLGSIVLNNVPGSVLGSSSVLTGAGKYILPLNNTSFLKLCSVCFGYTSTATVGSRNITVQISDGTNVYMKTTAAATQAASLSNIYMVGAGVPSSGFFLPLPELCYLPPNAQIVIADTAVIDTADTVTFANVIYLI